MREHLASVLLPNLLSNAVGRAGRETDGERSDTQDVLTNRCILGCTGTGQNGLNRIWRPLRNHSATWPYGAIAGPPCGRCRHPPLYNAYPTTVRPAPAGVPGALAFCRTLPRKARSRRWEPVHRSSWHVRRRQARWLMVEGQVRTCRRHMFPICHNQRVVYQIEAPVVAPVWRNPVVSCLIPKQKVHDPQAEGATPNQFGLLPPT